MRDWSIGGRSRSAIATSPTPNQMSATKRSPSGRPPGDIRGVVTQNIDGLHQMAGNCDVLELHGTARSVQCQDCGARFDAAPLVDAFLACETVPVCKACGDGRLKHATVSFGQSLPVEVLRQASEWCEQADLLLAIGSSLVVTPAADLPRMTKQHGGRLVIVNRDPTPLDSLADLVIHQGIGETLAAANAHLTAMLSKR